MHAEICKKWWRMALVEVSDHGIIYPLILLTLHAIFQCFMNSYYVVFVTDIVSRARMSHWITLAAPSPARKYSMPAAPAKFLSLIRRRRYVAAYILTWEPLLMISLYVMAHFSISSYFIF